MIASLLYYKNDTNFIFLISYCNFVTSSTFLTSYDKNLMKILCINLYYPLIISSLRNSLVIAATTGSPAVISRHNTGFASLSFYIRLS